MSSEQGLAWLELGGNLSCLSNIKQIAFHGSQKGFEEICITIIILIIDFIALNLFCKLFARVDELFMVFKNRMRLSAVSSI